MPAAPRRCQGRSAPLPARAYLGGCMSPCGPRGVGGWRWRGCGRRGGSGAQLAGPGARWEGLGRRWSPPPRPAQHQPGARRLLPGCMPASAWRSRPGSQPLALPQPSGSGGAARARETTAESGLLGPAPSLARPPPAAAARGVERFVCALGEGAGRAPRARAGGERGRERRWGRVLGWPRPGSGRTLGHRHPHPHPHPHPLGGWGVRTR